MAIRKKERKATIDVSIIIAAFLLCFRPSWIVNLCRYFQKSIKVPAEAVLITSCIFFVSTLCNPFIYSIRKRDFRTGVMAVFRRIGVSLSSEDIDNKAIVINNLPFGASLGTEASASTPAATMATQHQDARLPVTTVTARLNLRTTCLSPIAEVAEELH